MKRDPRDGPLVIVGPKDEHLAYLTRLLGPMIGVYYPYRKSGDLYCSTSAKHTVDGRATVFCAQCQEQWEAPKRGPSVASERKFTRHILSHHRRSKTLLVWFDGLPKKQSLVRLGVLCILKKAA